MEVERRYRRRDAPAKFSGSPASVSRKGRQTYAPLLPFDFANEEYGEAFSQLNQ